MEMQWIRENMETEQIISARPTQVTVEAEVALPGGLREEARVYYADGSVQVNGGELAGSRVTADGRVTFHVLFAQGDLAHISALEASADFSQAMPLTDEQAQPAAVRVKPMAQVQRVTAKAFNGRLLLQAIVNLTAEAAVPRSVSFIQDAAPGTPVERATQTIALQRTVGEGENQILLREEFELSDVLKIKDTLFATALAQAEDITGGSGGTATVTGTVTIEACHTSDLPGRPLVYTRHTAPYEQQVTLSGALGSALTARTLVRDAAVLSQEGENGRIMRAEIQLTTEMTAVEDSSMTILSDVFTTEGDALETHTQQVVFRNGTVNETAAESGRTVLTLPEGSPRMKTALLAFVRPVLVEARRQKDKLAADGILDITLIYQADGGAAPFSVRQEEPFHVLFDTQAQPEDHLSLTVSQVDPSAVTGDRAELKYILRLNADGVRKQEAQVLVDVQAQPAQETFRGITLYYLQPEETLWDAAKHCRLSMEEIRRLNPSLEAEPHAGTPVLAYKR